MKKLVLLCLLCKDKHFVFILQIFYLKMSRTFPSTAHQKVSNMVESKKLVEDR